jgi:hypothetical protein
MDYLVEHNAKRQRFEVEGRFFSYDPTPKVWFRAFVIGALVFLAIPAALALATGYIEALALEMPVGMLIFLFPWKKSYLFWGYKTQKSAFLAAEQFAEECSAGDDLVTNLEKLLEEKN